MLARFPSVTNQVSQCSVQHKWEGLGKIKALTSRISPLTAPDEGLSKAHSAFLQHFHLQIPVTGVTRTLILLCCGWAVPVLSFPFPFPSCLAESHYSLLSNHSQIFITLNFLIHAQISYDLPNFYTLLHQLQCPKKSCYSSSSLIPEHPLQNFSPPNGPRAILLT